MNRRQLLALGTALAGAWLAGCSGTPVTKNQLADAVVPPPDASAPQLTPIDAFADALNRRLAPKATNLVWSPWSVAMVLAMLRDGAGGATASEFDKLLHADATFDARLADGWRRMAHATGEPLHAGNAVWAQAGPTWKQPFRDKLTALAASLKVVDFTMSPATVEREINAWVSDRTAKKIPELLNGDVDASTRMVLVNAVHFKAPWQVEFAEAPGGDFRTPTKTVQTPYLQGNESFEGYRGGGWTAATVPCQNGEFDLVVALADDPAVAPSACPWPVLTGSAAASGPASAHALVSLTMPAWKLRYRAKLEQILAAAGIPTAFDPTRADFSAMTADEPLYVGFVVHQATIEVTAKGIEAAAATAAGMRASGAAAEPVPLRLDRPFAYALVHRATRTPLFVGQVADPTAQESELA